MTQVTRNNPYSQRIIRRIRPVIIGVILLFAVVSLIGLTATAISNVQNTQRLNVTQVEDRLQSSIDFMVGSFADLSRDALAVVLASGLGSENNPQQSANTTEVREFLASNPSLYQSVRLVRRDGTVLYNARNVSGIAVAEVLPQTNNTDPEFLSVPIVQDMFSGTQRGVGFGEFQLRRDSDGLVIDPPELTLKLYTPVFVINNIAPNAVLELTLNAESMLAAIINPAFDEAQTDGTRRVMLIDAQNRIVADSGTTGTAYLATFEAENSNRGFSDVFNQVSRFAAANDDTAVSFVGGIEGVTITSDPVTFNNASAPGWKLAVVDNTLAAFQGSTVAAILIVVAAVLLIFAALWTLRRLIEPILQPVATAESIAMQLAGDDRPDSESLEHAVERIAARFSALDETVSTQVVRRNRDLQVAGRIGRETATIDDLDTLLRRAINLICNELGYYHAQVFLVNDEGTHARLTYSRGEVGQQLLEQHHEIEIGSHTVIGVVTGERRPVIINDTTRSDSEVPHGYNPLLPDTRAEMGLPLIIGDELIGALDVQSTSANVFKTEDIPTFQLLADQLSIAIYNARLKQQSEQRFQQIDRLNRQLTQEAWQDAGETAGLKPKYGAEMTPDESNGGYFSVPIRIRNEVIGSLDAALADNMPMSEGDRMIVQAVAERVALAIENARLFQQTQTTLSETSMLYQLSRKLNEAGTLEDVMHAIITTVAPDASSGQIWLFDDEPIGKIKMPVRLSVDLDITGERQLDEPMVLDRSKYKIFEHMSPTDALMIENTSSSDAVDAGAARLFEQFGARAAAFIPLTTRGDWRGFSTIMFPGPRRFNDRDERLFRALVSQAGVAIDNRLLLLQTEQALDRQQKLYTASRLIITAGSFEDLVYAAVATSNDESLEYWLGLTTDEVDEETGWSRTVRIIARSKDGMVELSDDHEQVFAGEGSPLREQSPLVVNEDSPAVQTAWLYKHGLKFAAMFPLFGDNQPIGLFYIVSDKPHTLTDDDYEAYASLSGQISIQIQNRRLLQRTEEALAETRRLYVASRTIAAASDMTTLYDAVAGHLALPFLEMTGDGDAVEISMTVLLAQPTPSPDAPQLIYDYQWHSDPMVTPDVAEGTVIDHAAAPFGKLLDEVNEGTLRYHEGAANIELPEEVEDILTGGGFKFASVAPLRSATRWFGVLLVRTNRANILDDNYNRFLLAISDQIASAIDRQKLLAETVSERENLNAILSTLPTGVLVLDPDTMIPVQRNDRLEELLGQPVSTEEPFSAARYNLYTSGTDNLYPDDSLPPLAARKHNDNIYADDISVATADQQIDLLVNAAPIYDSSGSLLGIVTAFEDVTQLRSLEISLQRQLRESVTQYETQRSLVEAENLDEILDSVMGRMNLEDVSNAFIVLSNPDDDGMVIARAQDAGTTPHIDELREVLQSSSVRLTDAKAKRNAKRQVDETGPFGSKFRSVIAAPMKTRTRPRPLGWLVLADEQKNRFDNNDERILLSLSDMAASAIDNSYLFESTQEALQEMASLYNATNSISRARNEQELTAALKESLSTLRSDMAAVIIDAGSGPAAVFKQGFEESEELGLELHELAFSPLPEPESGAVFIDDSATAPDSEILQRVLQGRVVAAFAGINLRIKDGLGGRVLLGYREPHRFTEGEKRYLMTVADSTSVVLDNQVLLEQVQASLQETSVLYQASRALIEVNKAEDLLDVIVNYIADPHVSQVLVGVINRADWDVKGVSLMFAAAWSDMPGFDLTGVRLTPDQFPAWDLLATDTVKTFDDLNDPDIGLSELERDSFTSLNSRSVAIIPLRTPNRVIGVILLGSSEPHHFTESDLRTYQSFSEQSSLSLQASQLLEQAERRARQMETSSVISQTVGQILDLDVLLPQVVDLIKTQFDYDHVQVFLMDDADDYAELVASTGEAGQQLLEIKHKLRKGSDSVIGQVTETAEPVIAFDTADANVVHRPNAYLPMTRSEMALPLIVKGQVVGALDVQSNEPDAFTDEDRRALTTLAGQISVAIDNARLYNEAAERANEMSFLFDITTAAAAADSLEESLQYIAERVHDSLGTVSAAVYLPQIYVDPYDNEMITVRAMALAGDDVNIAELVEINLDDDDNLIAITGAELKPQIVGNVKNEPRYKPISTAARSAILAPISSGSSLIGVIALEGGRLRQFAADTQTLLLTLAGSIAAIIQNRQLVEELQATNDRLVEIDRLKSQFLASMSHELRTPLNSIIGFSRVMLKGIDGPLTEMQEQDLNTIYTSGNHLLNLINDILDQAKIEANQMQLTFKSFDVKEMIETVRAIAIGSIKERDKTGTLDLNVDISPNIPAAYGDDFRSRQIVINLVTNAIKFTPEGTVTVRAYAYQDEERGQKMVRIDVIDTGIGIEKKDMPILFEQFRQVDNSLTRTVGGTGLGLPISRALAEMQGGELLVESEVGKGSTFSVTIPTEPIPELIEEHGEDEDDPPPPQQSSSSNGSSNGTQKKKPRKTVDTSETSPIIPPGAMLKREVLLIEDNKDMVDQFRRTLQREGFGVQTADQPAYATAMVSNLRPNVVILDVNFAEGKGWEILADLKDRDDTFDIPIIVTTTDEDAERAYQLGASKFLSRPFESDTLVEVVLAAEEESNRERILIIDDQPDSVRLLTQLLGNNGNYRVFSANNASDGISLVARRHPDLILLDLRMPETDGFSVLNELRHNPETAKIPVLVVTGEVDFNSEERDLLDNVHVLQKTDVSQEDYDNFIEAVRNHLNHGNGEKS